MIQINCSVIGLATDIPSILIDNGHRYFGVFESPQRVIFTLPDSEPPWGAWYFTAGQGTRFFYYADPLTTIEHIPDHPGAYEGAVLSYAPPLPVLARLEPDGDQLRVNGKPWTWAMMTGFCDYQLLLTGRFDELRAVCQQAKDLGANGRRVLGMMAYITHFDPHDFGQVYYDRLPQLVSIHTEYGLRTKFDVFADNQVYNFGLDHFARVCDKLRPLPAALIDAGNEWPKNGFDPLSLPYPGVFSSQGSTTSDAAPPMPGWGLRMWHGRRDYPKVFMSADDMVYVARGLDEGGHQYAPLAPIVHDEPMGFAEVNIPNRRSTDPRLAQSLMLSGRAFGAGATLHAEDAIFSRLLGPQQQVCARAFFDAQG